MTSHRHQRRGEGEAGLPEGHQGVVQDLQGARRQAAQPVRPQRAVPEQRVRQEGEEKRFNLIIKIYKKNMFN